MHQLNKFLGFNIFQENSLNNNINNQIVPPNNINKTNPGLFLFVGIILPCIVLLLIVIPTKKYRTDGDKTRSPFRIVRWVFLVYLL